MRDVLKKGQTLQGGMLESLDLVNGSVWLEKIFSGAEGKEERRAYYVPGVVCMSHLMCTVTPKQYNFVLFERN